MTASLNDPTATIPAPHHRHPRDTEVLAAQLITPNAGTLRKQALDAFTQAADGLTDQELADVTNRYLYSIAPRRVELVRMGWIHDTGARRRSPRGIAAVVWGLTDEARRKLRLPVPA
jgi:hypothetical protein